MADFKQITDILGEITYPAYKEDIIQHAVDVSASEDIIDDLETLPDQEFIEEMDVWDQLGLVVEE